MKQYAVINNSLILCSDGTLTKPAYSDLRRRHRPEWVYAHKISTHGYPMVNVNRHWTLLHRLLAIHFIPNPDNKREVNHKNGIRTDFRLENLEWVTREENQLHSWRELGRKHPAQNKGDYLGYRAKGVKKYDVDGNLINEYGSVLFASRANDMHHSKIKVIIDTMGGYYKGNYWAYNGMV